MKLCPSCKESNQDNAVFCSKCGRNLHDLARPAHWFWYLVIGLASIFGLSIIPVLLILPAITAGNQPSDATLILGLMISLGVFPFYLCVATKAWYGEIDFWGFCNVLVLTAISFAAWWTVYYFGKGIYMLFTKQNLPMPNKPSKTGGILLICCASISVFIIGIYSIHPEATQSPDPTRLATRTPYGNSSQVVHGTFPPTPTFDYIPITWEDLVSFLQVDNTNINSANKYDPDYYTCLDFSVNLVENAKKQNIKAWVVGVDFTNEDKGHAFVAFDTTDLGIVFIEPQLDIRWLDPVVGQSLCLEWGNYKCMGTIALIQYMQCDHEHYCTKYTP